MKVTVDVDKIAHSINGTRKERPFDFYDFINTDAVPQVTHQEPMEAIHRSKVSRGNGRIEEMKHLGG